MPPALGACGTTRSNLGIDRQYHADTQGTVGALTSGGESDSGIASLTFDAWGTKLSMGGPGDTGGGSGPVAPPTLVNAGFETPNVGSGSGAYVGNPTGPGVGWTFANSTGVSGNGSAFTGGNPDAPEGSQVGYLQITGSCSQPVTLAVAGTLQVSFLAAWRADTGDIGQTVQVSIGSTVVGTFDLTAADTDYASYSTTPLLLAAGTYALTIAGTNALGDNTAFIDAVTLAFTPTGIPATLVNPGFEVPSLGTGGSAYEYGPTGSGVGWTFGAGTGVSGNGSAFTNFNPDAPQDAQVGFLQGTGAISQSVTLAEAGSLVVSFQAAQRSNGGSVNSQQIQVSLGSSVLGAPITPTGIDYALYSTEPTAVEAGTYDLTFTGLNPMGGDNTAFIDAVTAVVTPTGGGGGSSLADNPFGYLGGLGYWQDPAVDDSGLQYVRQRWLENASGQWLSVDPVDSEPRYGYAHNAPTIYTDNGGMQADGQNRTPQWSFYRWLYTGDGHSSDESYQAALGQASDTLEERVNSIQLVNRTILDKAEHALRAWIDNATPSQVQTLSQIFAVIAPFTPGEGVSDLILSQIDRLFGGNTSRQSADARRNAPAWVQVLTPPEAGTKDNLEYKAGFLWSIFDFAVSSINIPNQVASIFQALLLISKTEDLWGLLKETAQHEYQDFVTHLNDKTLPEYEKGKLAGTIVVNVIFLVLAVVSAIQLGRKAVGAIKRVGEFLRTNARAKQISDAIRVLPHTIRANARSQMFKVKNSYSVLRGGVDMKAALRTEVDAFYNELKGLGNAKVKERLRLTDAGKKPKSPPELCGVAMSPKSKYVGRGVSHFARPGEYPAELRDAILAAKPTEPYPDIDNCAAIDAVNDLLRQDPSLKISDIVFVEIKFRGGDGPGEFVRSCTVCSQHVLKAGAVNPAGATYVPLLNRNLLPK